jgi:phosphate transport system ATP-binding protein
MDYSHAMTNSDIKIALNDLCFFYGTKQVLLHVGADFRARRITAVVGPSGQGKSTLLTVFNRLWKEIPGARLMGKVIIRLDGQWTDVRGEEYPTDRLRRKVGMVFQDPNPLPMSIYKNVAFPLKLAGEKDKQIVESKVFGVLKEAFLWEEVKDRLRMDARTLSGGQQQRLCIARTLITRPEILLLDEPTASLDARACDVIENLLMALKTHCTIIMVSHYMDQVRRVADCVMELKNGSLLANDRFINCGRRSGYSAVPG